MQSIDAWLQQHQGDFGRELRLLAAKHLGLTKTEIFTNSKQDIPLDLATNLFRYLKKLDAGTPFFYLYGKREFWSLDFEVNENVLIPRPETELIVEKAAEVAKQNGRVLELGTGSGAISIALSKERPDLEIVATDVSLQAIQTAEKNARKHDCKIDLIASDWFSGLTGKWDLILSNPPYISVDDPHLENLKNEPTLALVAGESGYEALDQIIQHAYHYLKKNGFIILEHGFDQALSVEQKLKKQYFKSVSSHQDLNQIKRIAMAQKD